jgi:ribonuclease VapC
MYIPTNIFEYSTLRFGDCFSYACAKENRLPLLFKGDDFSKTDIDAA